MKQYFTGFFTGACLVASAVMFMGAGEPNSKIGKYQGFSIGEKHKAIYIIDTETGQLYIYKKEYWKPMESTFFEE